MSNEDSTKAPGNRSEFAAGSHDPDPRPAADFYGVVLWPCTTLMVFRILRTTDVSKCVLIQVQSNPTLATIRF